MKKVHSKLTDELGLILLCKKNKGFLIIFFVFVCVFFFFFNTNCKPTCPVASSFSFKDYHIGHSYGLPKTTTATDWKLETQLIHKA